MAQTPRRVGLPLAGRIGRSRLLIILAIIFLSWFAWIFYFFFAPVFDKPQRPSYY